MNASQHISPKENWMWIALLVLSLALALVLTSCKPYEITTENNYEKMMDKKIDSAFKVIRPFFFSLYNPDSVAVSEHKYVMVLSDQHGLRRYVDYWELTRDTTLNKVDYVTKQELDSIVDLLHQNQLWLKKNDSVITRIIWQLYEPTKMHE